jgi:hypothetical protein
LRMASADVTSLTVEDPITMIGSSAIIVEGGVTLSVTNAMGFDVNVESSSTLTLEAGSALVANAVRVSAGTMNANIDLSFPVGSDFELSSAGQMNVLSNATFGIQFFDPANIKGGTMNVSAGSMLDAASGDAVIGSGVTLVKDGAFRASDEFDDLTVLSGGVVTHSLRLEAGLVLDVADTLDVRAGGSVDVSAKGLRGGNRGAFGVNGEAYNDAGVIVSGAVGGVYNGTAGASYGGRGWGSVTRPTNAPYGKVEEPIWLGSGGAGGVVNDGWGGSGGGRVTVDASVLIVNGAIRSNGGNAEPGGNGTGASGSGGSVWLRVGTLSGAGSIEAKGGTGFRYWAGALGGGGGGGRIAISYDTNMFPEANVLAQGGTTVNILESAYYGGAGTIYLKDNVLANGVLIVDNGTVNSPQESPLRTSLATFKEMRIRNTGRLGVASANVASLAVEDVRVESSATLTLGAGVAVAVNTMLVNAATMNTNTNLSFPEGSNFGLLAAGQVNISSNAVFNIQYFDSTNVMNGVFHVDAGSALDVSNGSAVIGAGVTFVKDGAFGATDEFDDLTVLSGGVVTHSLRLEAGLVLNVADTLDVRLGGAIDVSAKGLRGGNRGSFGVNGEAYNDAGEIVSGAVGGVYNGTAGASHAGQGWGSTLRPTNAPYGIVEEPIWLGSGGAGGVASDGLGGSGGGRLTIDAPALVVNGAIRSNGGNAEPGSNGTGAAGSGGSVWLRVGSLSGTGSIEAKGGTGFRYWAGALGGGGGGGRVAVNYDMNTFPEAKIVAQGGTTVNIFESPYYGGAGTIYLKDNTDTYGKLIVDNQGIGSPAQTPFLTAVTSIPNVYVRATAHLAIPADRVADLGVIDSGEFISLEPGQLTCPDTLKINSGGTIYGTGTINANLVNSGVLSSGSGTGKLSIIGSYRQTSSGILESDIAGMTSYDHLHVAGPVGFGGRLAVSYLNGFMPPLESRYALISYTSHTGTFSEVTGIDTIAAVAYQDTAALLIEGKDYTRYSTFDPVLILSPVGTPSFHVVLRDSENQPVASSTNAWLDFTAVTGLVGCTTPPAIIDPAGASNTNGELEFNVKAGGCTADSAVVMTAHGMISKVPIRSLDHNGGLKVKATDFVGDVCNDYNVDGVVDVRDWNFFSQYLEQTCLGGPAQYFILDLHTHPGPDRLYVGDTISVCMRVTNTAKESAVLSHVTFATAHWGIALPWTQFADLQNVAIGGSESIELCVPFVLPADQPRHGCFRVSVTPVFTAGTEAYAESPVIATLMTDAPSSEKDGAEMYGGLNTGDQHLNVDSGMPGCHVDFYFNRDGDSTPNESDHCPDTPCGCAVNALGCAIEKGIDSRGKKCPRELYSPLDGRASSAHGPDRRSMQNLGEGTNTTTIPIGTEFGSTLYLCHHAFVPEGWSYAISDTGWVTTPDTVTISITHPVPALCGDTCRVVLYAYQADETFAGNAEARFCPLGWPGDVNFSYTVDSLDIGEMRDYLVQAVGLPPNIDGAEVNGDGEIDVADLTRIVDKVFAGGSLECMSAAAIDPYLLRYGQRHDTTFVLLDESRPIRGMQVYLIGTGSGTPVSSVSPEIELHSFGTADTLGVLLADLNGSVPITGTIAFAVPGSYTVTGGRIASLDYGSGDIEVTEVTSVLVSTFEAEPANAGISLRWAIQTDEQIRGFRLYRETDRQNVLSIIASESELSGEVRSYVDGDVRGGHTYGYVLGVIKMDGREVQSQSVQVIAKRFELTLSQNHPNPFNPATTIFFTLPEKTRVHLAIYDVAGRLVATLVDGSLDEGLHTAKWEGRNNNGSQVSSGVYFYRLVAGKQILTKKMVLLR